MKHVGHVEGKKSKHVKITSAFNIFFSRLLRLASLDITGASLNTNFLPNQTCLQSSYCLSWAVYTYWPKCSMFQYLQFTCKKSPDLLTSTGKIISLHHSLFSDTVLWSPCPLCIPQYIELVLDGVDQRFWCTATEAAWIRTRVRAETTSLILTLCHIQ